MNRIARGTLDRRVLPNPVDTLGLASLISRSWPERLPCERLGDVLRWSFSALGLAKVGATVALQFALFDCLCPSVLSAAVRMFDCENFDDGTSFLHADLSIKCQTAAHERAQCYSGLMIFVYAVVAPYLYFSTLRRVRHRLHPAADNELKALNMRASDRSIDGFRSIFASFRPHLWRVHTIPISMF